MALSVGDLLQGRYRVGAPLGRGGMGSVFEAREEPDGAEVAVKQLRLDAPELLEAFRGEFAVLARISEPHLVRVIDFGSERLRGELHHYYVAERVQGETIAARVRRSAGADYLEALADAVRGLSALHDADIRHGDFTPSNVLIERSGRGVLIDLGCARPFGPVTELAGTESFIAPELLAGKPGDARSDLYAIGRTLQVLSEENARPLPASVQRLTERLLRDDPAARPADCREVLELLGEKPSARRGPCLPARLLGRDTEIEAFETWLGQLGAGDAAPRCLEVWGPAGAGTSRLLRELTWRAQLAATVLRIRPDESIGRALSLALGIAEPISTRRGLLAAVGMLAERSEPVVLVVDDADQLDGEALLLLATLRRALGTSGSLALAWSARTPQAADLPASRIAAVPCGPLTAKLAEQWLAPWLSAKRTRELAEASGGYPGKLQQLLAEELGQTAQPAGRGGAKKSSLPELEPAEKLLLALFSAAGSALSPAAVGSSFAELQSLVDRRVLARDAGELRLTELGRALLDAGTVNGATLARAHRRIAEHLNKSPSATPGMRARLVQHWVLAGELAAAEAVFVAERELLARCERKDARLLGVLQRSTRPELLLDLSLLLLEQGAPRVAISCAARAARLGRDMSVRRRALLLTSDALARVGRPARAELLLARQLTGASAAMGPEAAEVLLRLARARLARGDYAGAKTTAESALERGPTPESAGLLREVLGVSCSYLGDVVRAEQELEQALSLVGEGQRPRERCRIQSHRAMLAFRAGRIEAALADYTAALSLAEQHDFDDLIATGLLNLGTAEQQAGLWGEALRHYDRGVAFASAIGRVTTELTLAFNLGNLYAEIGAFERADETLLALEQKLAASSLTHLAPSIALVRAEIGLSLGDAARVEQQLLKAEGLLAERPRELLEVRLRRVDLELLQNRPQEAERKLKALAKAEPAGASDLELGLELLRGRVDAALGRASALGRLESARARAQREGLLALEATLETELSRVAERSQKLDEARTRSERARRLWDRIGEGLPGALLSLFWRHDRRRHLLEQSRRFAVQPAAEAGQGLEAHRRLLSLNRRLNSSLSLERVLEYAVQAALDLTEAERAFLLLVADGQLGGTSAKPAAPLEVTLSRSSDPGVAPTEGPSQSIVRRTLEREEPILTTDAQGDPRFWGQGSVHAMRLKSVLSVPILAPSGVLGVLYVDCRVQRGRFSEAERELLAAFADQLALAIGNARLHRELEQSSAELRRQKHALEQLSRGKDREIERLKREVQSQRSSLELRYDYSQIVGRGPAMRQVLERLDRVVDSDASVLVLGESGTGKELVARALHWNGPRKAKPFMGINCAALPETLLESELFGHVRGAFTGADRDKQGLFLAAAGGTLFLDEIGELSPATQAKLLRVLQEREVRPLGAERAQPLDVRLVAATHRDLEQAMTDGRFREDLYYRLAVVALRLPPLRERPEDLPALAQRILERLARDAGRKPPELGQDALRQLSAHAFPGNVRELENILTRAFVLSTAAKLRAEDLDLGPTRAKKSRAGSRRDFEADERERILTALRASRWNVSVVSRSLGIPRNTLYRKLERYGLTRTAD